MNSPRPHRSLRDAFSRSPIKSLLAVYTPSRARWGEYVDGVKKYLSRDRIRRHRRLFALAILTIGVVVAFSVPEVTTLVADVFSSLF